MLGLHVSFIILSLQQRVRDHRSPTIDLIFFLSRFLKTSLLYVGLRMRVTRVDETDEGMKNDGGERVYGSVSLHKLSKTTMNTESTVLQRRRAARQKSTREFRGKRPTATARKRPRKKKRKEGTEL